MSTSRNSTATDTTSPEMPSWMVETRKCSHVKYAIFSRELIQTLPTASALRLLRAQLQRDPRFAGKEVPETIVWRTYENLVPDSQIDINRSMPDLAGQLNPKTPAKQTEA